MATQHQGDRELPAPKASGSRRLSVAAKRKMILMGVGALVAEGVSGAIWATAKLTAYLITSDVSGAVLGSALLGAAAAEGISRFRNSPVAGHGGLGNSDVPDLQGSAPDVSARSRFRRLGTGALIGEGVTGVILAGAKLTSWLISTNVVGVVVGSAALGIAGAVAVLDYRAKKAAERPVTRRAGMPAAAPEPARGPGQLR